MKRKVKLSTLFVATVSFVLVQIVLFPAVSRSEYPDRPVTVLVSFDPGSTTDLIARTLTIGAEKALGTRLEIGRAHV
jgi:tripartite-type tricarboxylate transporter receptor subunit TctC